MLAEIQDILHAESPGTGRELVRALSVALDDVPEEVEPHVRAIHARLVSVRDRRAKADGQGDG